MNDTDDVATTNRRFWDGLSAAGCDLTQPWLGLSRQLLERYARGDASDAPDALFDMYPADILAGAAGREVLCLASGGGQQSAAEHYGYRVRCVLPARSRYQTPPGWLPPFSPVEMQ